MPESTAHTLLITMAALCAAYLSWQDWHHESVPIWALSLWGLLFILIALITPPHYDTFIALTSLSAFLYAYQWFRQKELIGFADIIVIVSLSLWIQLDIVPLFLALTGILGTATAYLLTSKRFPFLPSIFIASAITLIFQSFNRILP
ncbi:MAG: hypothetical protein Q8S21_04555 [Candidatus Paracaedibacteraceae bacterium]|nr:hypothetical protein [Candidatus Paracaedibacteraceae bacterium]